MAFRRPTFAMRVRRRTLVEGVFQVDVQIPANVHHPGNLSVVVQVRR